MKSKDSPWLSGVAEAARYASMREERMKWLIAAEIVESRLKPADEHGHRPKGLLVFAPSIDALIHAQPSGASEVAKALASTR